jgi:hypothetical protein
VASGKDRKHVACKGFHVASGSQSWPTGLQDRSESGVAKTFILHVQGKVGKLERKEMLQLTANAVEQRNLPLLRFLVGHYEVKVNTRYL